MKKLLLLLLIAPVLGFGQIMIEPKNKKNPRIDLTKIETEFIDVAVGSLINCCYFIDYGFKDKKGKKVKFRIRKKTQVYDGNNLVDIISRQNLINYFAKWGFLYEDTIVRTRVNPANGQVYRDENLIFEKRRSVKSKIDKNLISETAKELKSLKELFDLGIISKDEYDKKAEVLKKKILNN